MDRREEEQADEVKALRKKKKKQYIEKETQPFKRKEEEAGGERERKRESISSQIGLGQFVVTQRLPFLGTTTVNDVWQAHPHYWLSFTHARTHTHTHTHISYLTCTILCGPFQKLRNTLYTHTHTHTHTHTSNEASLATPLPLSPHSFSATTPTFLLHTQLGFTCINNSGALSLHDD